MHICRCGEAQLSLKCLLGNFLSNHQHRQMQIVLRQSMWFEAVSTSFTELCECVCSESTTKWLLANKGLPVFQLRIVFGFLITNSNLSVDGHTDGICLQRALSPETSRLGSSSLIPHCAFRPLTAHRSLLPLIDHPESYFHSANDE